MEEDGQDTHMKQKNAWGGEEDERPTDHLRDGTDGEQRLEVSTNSQELIRPRAALQILPKKPRFNNIIYRFFCTIPLP